YCELIGFQASIACSFKLRLQSGITKSRSTSKLVPNPSQVGHAPKGLLKENNLGSNSPMENPQIGQACFSLNNSSSCSITSTTMFPSPSFSAVSMESLNRLVTPSFTIIRSTTTSIECFLFLS